MYRIKKRIRTICFVCVCFHTFFSVANAQQGSAATLRDYKKERQLLTLAVNPPAGTTAVRFFIDSMQVSELTNEYAVKTKTPSVWKTVIDPQWLTKGNHDLRIEASTPNGVQTLETKKIVGTMETVPGKLSLTGAWKFASANELPAGALEGASPAAITAGYKEGQWTTIFVPNSLGAVSAKWNTYEGILGIYRKSVDIDLQKGAQTDIVLESCYWSGRVFVNGVAVGETHGGYLSSRFDISKAVQQGVNDIAIIVDNRFSSMGAFKRLNEFYWNWGGLVQEVFIRQHPATTLIDLRAEGTSKGIVSLQVTGINNTGKTQQKKIMIEVVNAAGKRVAGPVNQTLDLPMGSSTQSLKDIVIAQPILWDIDRAYLYTVIIKGDFGILQERTGCRDVLVKGADILLNGKVLQGLQGFNRHADYPGLGRTQPAGLAYQELKMLKEKGFQFFRPAHYPTTPQQLDAADELGLLVIEEVNVTGLKGAVMASAEVIDFGKQQLRKMIARDRSHPSVIAWSVGNENLTEEEGAETYVREVIALGRSLDARRLYTQVTHRHTNDRTFAYQDFVAQNYYAGWYAKDINAIVTLFDAIQSYAGNKPVMLSEYGAEAVIQREGTTKSSEFYQGMVVDAHNRLLNHRKHFFGKMYWCSTEFWCRPNWHGGSPDPVPPFHVKSLISLDRQYKKLGWRVIFSPVRIVLNPHTVKANDLGGDVVFPADKDTTITQVVTVREIRDRMVKGTLSIQLPAGFTSTTTTYPFALQPGEGQSFRITMTGRLSTGIKSADCIIRAVIDEDTEAQPVLMSLKLKELMN